MNIRMQVTIPEQDHARATARAGALGISFAEYLRRLVLKDLEDLPDRPQPDVRGLFGIGDSGGGDVGRHKDAYLGEALAAAKARASSS